MTVWARIAKRLEFFQCVYDRSSAVPAGQLNSTNVSELDISLGFGSHIRGYITIGPKFGRDCEGKMAYLLGSWGDRAGRRLAHFFFSHRRSLGRATFLMSECGQRRIRTFYGIVESFKGRMRSRLHGSIIPRNRETRLPAGFLCVFFEGLPCPQRCFAQS
jgi:hypothetical protein